MPKTNAEYCRDYRKKKRENKIKKIAKSSTERVREFRARQKVLTVENNSSITHNDDFTVQNSKNDHNNEVVNFTNNRECSQYRMNSLACPAICHSGKDDLKLNGNITYIKEEIHEVEETIPVDGDIGDMLIKVEETQVVHPNCTFKESDECSKYTHSSESQEHNIIEIPKSSYRNCVANIYICKYCNKTFS